MLIWPVVTRSLTVKQMITFTTAELLATHRPSR